MPLLLVLAMPCAVNGDEKTLAKPIPPAAPGKIDFRTDIEPILTRACLACHGPDKQRAGLRLDNKKAAFDGSNTGPVLKPGRALESQLFRVLVGLDADVSMPPKGKKSLSAAEIAKIRAWIEQGAAWPDDKTATSTQARSEHWSFQVIRKPAIPGVSNPGWVKNAIDAFILARLDKEKIAPSPEADRVTLLRRLSLDLLGLPPTPADVDAFVNDSRPDAYEKLVDKLLASPHYGERWGRHWLDLARYADSDGYEADRIRPFAWRFRDWVIDALNRNLPFDQFTIEQLAGDLLPNATLQQKAATGFHRNTLTNKEGGVDQEQFRVEAVVDRVNTTGKAWLGITIGCAQCHDHKYDPFSQREFYQLFAFFNSDNEVDIPAASKTELDKIYAASKAEFDKKHHKLQAAVDDYRQTVLLKKLPQWEATLARPERHKLPAELQKILSQPAGQRSHADQGKLIDQLGKTDDKLIALKRAVYSHSFTMPRAPSIPTLALGKHRPTHVLIRGDFLRPGIEVRPGTPAVLSPWKLPLPDGRGSPTRLDLARWLVGPDNPLTARVISNWVWHHYFGRGIVATLEDFGTQGELPSHPELLDFLAGSFKVSWDLKALHKLIVMSATYRQSSKYRPELATRDPANVWLARQNRLRLEAEIIRDVSLAASGLLVPTIGGPSVKPPQPAGVSELTYANSARWTESKGPDRFRRGLYTWFQRTSPYPMLTTFDAPDGVLCCARREKSNTPLQALTLLNDQAFVECAQALGRRLLADKQMSPAERLTQGFLVCLGRRPTAEELAALETLHTNLQSATRAQPKEAARLAGTGFPAGTDPVEAATWTALARTLLNLDEFINRE